MKTVSIIVYIDVMAAMCDIPVPDTLGISGVGSASSLVVQGDHGIRIAE